MRRIPDPHEAAIRRGDELMPATCGICGEPIPLDAEIDEWEMSGFDQVHTACADKTRACDCGLGERHTVEQCYEGE